MSNQTIVLSFTVECGRGNLTKKHKVPFQVTFDLTDTELLSSWLQDKARRVAATSLEVLTDEVLEGLLKAHKGVLKMSADDLGKTKAAVWQSPERVQAEALANLKKSLNSGVNIAELMAMFQKLMEEQNQK